MTVGLHQAGPGVQPRGVEDLRALRGGEVLADGGDFAPVDQDVADAGFVVNGVVDVGVLDQFHRRAPVFFFYYITESGFVEGVGNRQ